MWPIATVVTHSVVCVSVCLSRQTGAWTVQNGWTDRDAIFEADSCKEQCVIHVSRSSKSMTILDWWQVGDAAYCQIILWTPVIIIILTKVRGKWTSICAGIGLLYVTKCLRFLFFNSLFWGFEVFFTYSIDIMMMSPLITKIMYKHIGNMLNLHERLCYIYIFIHQIRYSNVHKWTNKQTKNKYKQKRNNNMQIKRKPNIQR